MIPIRRLLPSLALLLASCSAEETLVDRLDARIPPVVATGNSPSVQVAVVEGGRVVWSRGFGEQPETDRIYMCASVQKVFDSVLALRLVERGVLDLDEPVDRWLDFPVRHPDQRDTPVSLRMILSHRSGLGEFRHQFARDTESVFVPAYRAAAPRQILALSARDFIVASIQPGGANWRDRSWVREPGTGYHYSVSAYPLLHHLIEEVTGTDFPGCATAELLEPLGMVHSGFELSDHHATPHVRFGDENVELELWSGSGDLMHTTADDLARLMIALMGDGAVDGTRILEQDNVELMRRRTSRFRWLFRGSEDMHRTGHGLGLGRFRGGWYGYGGSVPGYQCLWRFNPDREVGFVVLSNVNAILSGGDNYPSARREVYIVQDELLAILDPALPLRGHAAEVLYLLGVMLIPVIAVVRAVRKRRRKNNR